MDLEKKQNAKFVFSFFSLQSTTNFPSSPNMESYFHPPYIVASKSNRLCRINGCGGLGDGNSNETATAQSAISAAAAATLTSSLSSIAIAAVQATPRSTTASALLPNLPPTPSSPLSINDACRWSNDADESYDGGGNVYGYVIDSGNHSQYGRRISATNDDGSGNGSGSGSNSICDVVDSSVRYGIEGDIHRNNNNHANSIDLKCGHSGTDATHTVINYMLRDIMSGLTMSMKTLNRISKCSTCRTPWWKSIISIVIYMLLVTATVTRPSMAHKHEGMLYGILYVMQNILL